MDDPLNDPSPRLPSEIVVDASATAHRDGSRVVWVGAAQVRLPAAEGRCESFFFEFGNHPSASRADALAFAQREAVARVEASRRRREPGRT